MLQNVSCQDDAKYMSERNTVKMNKCEKLARVYTHTHTTYIHEILGINSHQPLWFAMRNDVKERNKWAWWWRLEEYILRRRIYIKLSSWTISELTYLMVLHYIMCKNKKKNHVKYKQNAKRDTRQWDIILQIWNNDYRDCWFKQSCQFAKSKSKLF